MLLDKMFLDSKSVWSAFCHKHQLRVRFNKYLIFFSEFTYILLKISYKNIFISNTRSEFKRNSRRALTLQPDDNNCKMWRCTQTFFYHFTTTYGNSTDEPKSSPFMLPFPFCPSQPHSPTNQTQRLSQPHRLHRVEGFEG